MPVDEQLMATDAVPPTAHRPPPTAHSPRTPDGDRPLLPPPRRGGDAHLRGGAAAGAVRCRDVGAGDRCERAAPGLRDDRRRGGAARAGPAEARRLLLRADIARIIARERPDIVHVQGVHTLVAPLAMLAAWRAGIPYVVTFHTGGNRSRLRNALRGAQWRRLSPPAGVRGAADRRVAVRGRLLPRQPAPARRALRGHPQRRATAGAAGELPAQGPGPLIVSVGRLEHYKGHHRVIAALPHVQSRHYPSARLLILGSGPYRGRCYNWRPIAASPTGCRSGRSRPKRARRWR